jgi:hypothetical protein
VNPKQTVHIVTDRNGRIIGAMRPPSPDSQVQVRVEPLDGQRCVEVRLPPEVPSLQTAEDFQKLVERFHVPRGRTALVPRVIAANRSRAEKGRRKAPRNRR